jgi:hypothetical protein
MRHWSLTRTLVVAFVCLGALPAAILGWRLIATTNAMSTTLADAQSRELGRSLHTVAFSLTDRLDRNLFERYGDAQACAVNTALLYHRAWYRVGNGRNRIVRAANRYVKLYGIYSLAMMVDLNGRVVAVNDRDANGKAIDTAGLYEKPYDNASWFQDAKAGRFLTGGNGALSGTVVQDVYIDEDVKKICGGDGRTLGFSAPVTDSKGRVVGVWNNRASFALLESMLTSAGHDLKSQGLTDVRLTLIDRAGRIIADYDPTRGDNDGLSRNMDLLLTVNLADRGTTSAREARSGHDGAVHEEDLRRGVWQMTGYAASRGAQGFPGLGWGLLARVDDQQATDESGDRARAEVMGVLITSLLLLGLAAWWLGRSIANPVIGGIARLKQNASQVSAVSIEVADASHRLSAGAREEAAAIEASSASMEEMSSMTRQNATHAEDAASLMSGARQLVDGANVALGGMVESMSAIQQATGGISKIIRTIDELAFQSNLLALNAAIEAARAGAAGAGFGVVADEVRSLAQRSAQAAKDTSTLIEASVARAREGSSRVDEVVQAMASITERLERLHGLLQQVKAASGQQTQGIDQVTQALTQMGQATQANANAAAESAATSDELTAVAHSALTVIANLERLINGTTPPPPVPASATTKASAAGRMPRATARQAQPGPRPLHPGERRRPTRAA